MRILVTIDESEHSRRALEKAKVWATPLGADVTILNVQSVPIDLKFIQGNAFYEEVNRNLLSKGKEIIKDALKVFEGFHGKVEAISRNGDIANEIINLAEENEFDLIIMGSRGMGIFSRTLLGSISDKVVHHVKTSVLIVK